MKGLVKRLREADKKIGSLALMDVYGRVARLLMEMPRPSTVSGWCQKAAQAGHREDDRARARW